MTTLTATVTKDALGPFTAEDDDEVGTTWHLGDTDGDIVLVHARAFDDDGEHYYNLDVILPVGDDEVEDALEALYYALSRHAGVTAITFPGRPHLNIS